MSRFPFTHLAVMTVLLFIDTKFLAVTSDQEFDEAYYKPLPPGYSYGYLQTTPSEKFYKRESLLQCAVVALNSQSQFFTYNKVSHVCKNYSPKDIMTVVSANDSNEISFYRSSKWIKTYAVSVGANSIIYNSFLKIGSPSIWNVDKCNGIYCPNFFRHPLLDIWNHLPIEQVKLVLYKNQADIVTMVFDGRNTTLQSWFSLNNLKSSPWTDLIPEKNRHFSVAGNGNTRRFYVSQARSSCSYHRGWLIIIGDFKGCNWEKSDYYPKIIYSKTNLSTKWHDEYGVADSMAIFIQL